jgi:hypothetical protein
MARKLDEQCSDEQRSHQAHGGDARELGFKTIVFPDGKRYEMKAGIPGGRRLN